MREFLAIGLLALASAVAHRRSRRENPKPTHNIRSPQTDTGYLYHATNYERAFEIVDGGLRTHRPWEGTDQAAWPDGHTEKRSYFSARADGVWHFAPEHGEPVVLRVPVSAASFRRESTGDYYSRDRIPASRIEFLASNGKWYGLGELE